MKQLFLVLCVLFCISCNKEKVDKLVLDELMAEKKERFFKEQEQKCKEKAFEAARTYVDSLANKWVQDDLLDTIDFPIRPTRPDRPADILEKH